MTKVAGKSDRFVIKRRHGVGEEERRRLTLEALAEVDAGHVIDHQAIQAWADGLDSLSGNRTTSYRSGSA